MSLDIKSETNDNDIDARKPGLFVTSLGEILRDGNLLIGGLNLADVQKEYGLPDKVIFAQPGTREHKLLKRACNQAWEKSFRESLNDAEYDFVKRVLDVQRAVNNDRFRVYAQKTKTSERIRLVTEFKAPIHADKFWGNLLIVKAHTNAHLGILLDEEEQIESWRTEADGVWHYGPNHGVLMRQVELSWYVEDISAPCFRKVLRAFVSQIRRETRKLWWRNGVSVL